MSRKNYIILASLFVCAGVLFLWFNHRRAYHEELANLLSNATTTPLFLPWRVDIGDAEVLATTTLAEPWFEYMTGEDGGVYGYQVTKRRNMMTGEEVEVSRTDGKGEGIPAKEEPQDNPFISPDGEAELYVETEGDETALYYHHFSTGRDGKIITLPKEYDTWTPLWTQEELLALVGIDIISDDGNMDIVPHKGRLLLIDLKRDILIYASPVLTGETGFIGFGGFHGFQGFDE